MSEEYGIRRVRLGSAEMEEVITLHGPHRRTLGFFPRGAFEDYARKEGILAAVGNDGRVMGYVAVRVSGGWTHIAHLCVGEQYRGRSIARNLVEQVFREAVKHQHIGVRLKCRADFKANGFWPNVGFTPRGQQSGRGADRRDLTVWIRRNADAPDLFILGGTDDPEKRIAVLDANTFFDLAHEDENPADLPERTRESLHLCAGWLQDAVELCFVDEIFHEISRRMEPGEEKRHRERLSRFRELLFDHNAVDAHYKRLQAIFGWDDPRTQQQSDMMQLAKAAAAGADFFVTRDEALLKAAPAVAEELLIHVLRPSSLLVSVDEEERGVLYSPARLAGTNVSVQVPTVESIDPVLEAFLGRNPQEKLHRFRELIRRVMAESAGRSDRVVELMSDGGNSPVVLAAYNSSSGGNLMIEVLRAAAHRLAPTAIRHVLLSVIQKAAKLGGRQITFADSHCSRTIEDALVELHFTGNDGRWHRVLHPEILPVNALEEALHITRPGNGWAPDDIIQIEDRFWPLKVQGMDVPCVVVTINDHWAAKLFDSTLAMEELFAVDPLRCLNRENVFYRHKDNWPRSDPKRILWYVSRTNTIRACSRLLNVERDAAFKLFRRYQRLGVYEWDDVMRATEGKPHAELMALHFTDTELFDHPVPLEQAKSIGVGKMVAGPQPITEHQFLHIYSIGFPRFSKT